MYNPEMYLPETSAYLQQQHYHQQPNNMRPTGDRPVDDQPALGRLIVNGPVALRGPPRPVSAGHPGQQYHINNSYASGAQANMAYPLQGNGASMHAVYGNNIQMQAHGDSTAGRNLVPSNQQSPHPGARSLMGNHMPGRMYEQAPVVFSASAGEDGSPLSSHSPSPAPTHVSQQYGSQQYMPQLKSVTALQHQAVNYEVSKPVLQNATAPQSSPSRAAQQPLYTQPLYIPREPPPPYPGRGVSHQMAPQVNHHQHQQPPYHQQHQQPQQHQHQQQMRPVQEEHHQSQSASGSDSLVSTERDHDNSSVSSHTPPTSKDRKQVVCVSSPRPDRKPEACHRDPERRERQVQHFSPQAYKFFMEQHIENVLKSYQQREKRRLQLETEMAKVGLSDEAATQMRKLLHQKESNYIRLKRAKMDKSMFETIKPLGIGGFGEVALVRKLDTQILYAMKKLRKRDVLRRNQVAHVKAERDILAEAECEWVVKLYYSFQDENNLYFVMDYIPGGDMMALLIKLGIFTEQLAQFYVGELVLAIESVHTMGFIHRDIKPDNILIDKDGHIKLTDFGLCTGFRWTHNSKYYQKGNHPRQVSMEPDEAWIKDLRKPLVRRNIRHQRCLAHSLVGTPNYIAPEVLLRSAYQTNEGGTEGYTRVCDWWSVGVILYEMLVGQPPFRANTKIETQVKVINWQLTLVIPNEANMSNAARDLIFNLLRGPSDRLGQRGATEIKEHCFFGQLNFKDLRLQPAPHQPQIRYPTDASNFDPVDPDKLRHSSNDTTPKRDGSLENGKHPEHAFLEFSFRRFFERGPEH